jgi:hypothetical protein
MMRTENRTRLPWALVVAVPLCMLAVVPAFADQVVYFVNGKAIMVKSVEKGEKFTILEMDGGGKMGVPTDQIARIEDFQVSAPTPAPAAVLQAAPPPALAPSSPGAVVAAPTGPAVSPSPASARAIPPNMISPPMASAPGAASQNIAAQNQPATTPAAPPPGQLPVDPGTGGPTPESGQGPAGLAPGSGSAGRFPAVTPARPGERSGPNGPYVGGPGRPRTGVVDALGARRGGTRQQFYAGGRRGMERQRPDANRAPAAGRLMKPNLDQPAEPSQDAQEKEPPPEDQSPPADEAPTDDPNEDEPPVPEEAPQENPPPS